MKIDILTLFPNLFDGFLTESIIKRAINKGIVEINLINFRDFSLKNNNQVDDTPYGGGAGMVLMCEPIVRAIESVRTEDSKVILLSPQGKVYNQSMAYEFREFKHLIFICGHYEGFDERIKNYIDYEVSIGDYILTGGEVPAMVIADSIIRLLKGVITEESFINDSFENNLLDYPVYTKPYDFRGYKVPDVLTNGNHQLISKWRKEKQIEITREKRPDLLKGGIEDEKK